MLTNSDNKNNNIKVRFAPSPTGMLHMGNVRAALFNYLFALKNNGTYLLRIDDTDLERSKAEFEQAIYDNLNWLGIKWNETFHQSERFERYNQVIQELKAQGLIYACYETAEELEYKRVRLRARGKPPVYDREGLNLSLQKKQAYEAEGRKPHYRFLLNQEEVRFNDLFRGDCAYNCANLSDPIIIREDGSLLYMLPSVIDDLDYNITHIIRGEDHITNAAVQIQMFNAIGGKAPIFGHFPLITGMDGKLSKRLGSLSIGEMKKQGIEPMAINTLIATLGTANPVKEPYKNLQEAAVDFDILGFGRSQPKFDVNELEHFNLRVIHNMDFNDVKKRLNDNIKLDFWEIVKPNLEKVEDALIWYDRIFNGNFECDVSNLEFLQKAASLLPKDIDENTWKIWTNNIKENTGVKGKDLFMPLRLALTGAEHGPEMSKILPLLKRDVIINRLKGEKSI